MTHTTRVPRAITLLLATFVLAACSLAGRHPAPPTATYVLEGVPTTATAHAPQTDLVLKVAPPDAAPAFTTSRIAYVERPYRVDYFAYNAWADPPARMLRTLLTRQLTNADLFRYVVADAPGIDAALRLDTEIVELVQLVSPTASEVRVTLHFDLVDVARRALLFSETITVTEPATARDPYAGVVAANRAVQRALDELVTRLREPVLALARQPAAAN